MNKADDRRYSYQIVPMTKDDGPTVVEFLNEFFYRQGPITGAVKITEDLESLEKLQNYGCKTFQDNCERIGLTLKAVSPNGDLMGVSVNDIHSRDYEEHYICNDTHGEDQEKGVNFKKFMALFEKIGKESDMWGKFPDVNRVMEIKIVAVDDKFRGQGVCKALFEKTIELASEHKCSLIYVGCSSYFSAQIADKLGFQCLYSLNYQEYKDDKGEVIFNASPPHRQFKAYVLPV